jgi:hypothetical protein
MTGGSLEIQALLTAISAKIGVPNSKDGPGVMVMVVLDALQISNSLYGLCGLLSGGLNDHEQQGSKAILERVVAELDRYVGGVDLFSLSASAAQSFLFIAL